jgi:hypothetical protein
MLATCQAEAPPVGLLEVTTLPTLSTATHSDELAHEIASSLFPGSTWVTFQAAVPPVGSLEVTTSPDPSPATHSVADGHDTVVRSAPSIGSAVHAYCPAVGSVEVSRIPPLTTAQNELDTHETDELSGLPAVKDGLSILVAEDQASGEATGLGDCAAAPATALKQETRTSPMSARRPRVR